MAGDEFRISPALRKLGQELHPLLQRLYGELAGQVLPSTRVIDPAALLSRHLGRLTELADRLAQSAVQMNTEVAANPQAGAADVQRAAARLTHCVDEIIASCREVRSLRAGGTAKDMPTLLAGVYMHVLGETASWLERLVAAIADPSAEIARQGLSNSKSPQIRLGLTLSAPPQMAALHQWAREHASQPMWGTATSLLLGWGLVSALFGNDCD